MSEKLGIAGGLTRSFISSALTPLFILAALAMGLVGATAPVRGVLAQVLQGEA